MNILKTLASVTLLSLVASTAFAGTDEDAKSAFTDGQKSFDNGHYTEASRQFQRAYDLKPSWKLLYNIAQAQAAAKQYGAALQTFEKYIAEGGDEIPVERIDEVRAEINRLRDMVGSVEVNAPDGCSVYLDEDMVGTTPLPGPLRITAGVSRTLKVTLNEKVLLTRPVNVGSREQIVVDVADIPTDESGNDNTTALQTPLATSSENNRNPLIVAGWVTAGVGVAALIGGGVAGGLALKWNNELGDSASCTDTACAPGEHGTIDKRDKAALASTILFSTGGAITVAGVVMILVGRKKGNEKLSFVPVIRTGMLGAAIQGRF